MVIGVITTAPRKRQNAVTLNNRQERRGYERGLVLQLQVGPRAAVANTGRDESTMLVNRAVPQWLQLGEEVSTVLDHAVLQAPAAKEAKNEQKFCQACVREAPNQHVRGRTEGSQAGTGPTCSSFVVHLLWNSLASCQASKRLLNMNSGVSMTSAMCGDMKQRWGSVGCSLSQASVRPLAAGAAPKVRF